MDKKVVGPAFKDVAAKYAGDSGAQAKLEQIADGVQGVQSPFGSFMGGNSGVDHRELDIFDCRCTRQQVETLKYKPYALVPNVRSDVFGKL